MFVKKPFSTRSVRRFGAVLLAVGVIAGAAIPASSVAAEDEVAHFDLVLANPKLLGCLANDGSRPPSAEVTVKRGKLNDTLTLELENIKPNLDFDLFTVQRSNKLANGAADPDFKGSFGLAWYQSDLHSNKEGKGSVTVKTILLDQIFGFDPDVSLQPLNTFHVGFWFNNPDDAAPCVGQVVTPFNGEHHAGPLAMISTPDAVTNLGPLCISPSSSSPSGCNP